MEHKKEQEKANVFNIQHFSIHDGPGIRTVVFVKGCPLRCRWCANPESQKKEIELGWTKGECIGCRECEKRLTDLRCHFDQDGLKWDQSQKFDTETVEKVCPSKTFHIIGKAMSVEEAFEEVKKDRVFYQTSGGGLTISGGEPLFYPVFTHDLLEMARREGIHTAIETTLCASEEVVLAICGELDLLIMDIKSMDEEKHKIWTGVTNKLVLSNLASVRKNYPDLPILVRTPIIPGFNDSVEDIKPIVNYIKELQEFGTSAITYEPLKYHQLGLPKYESLHRVYEMGDAKLEDGLFEEIKAYVKGVL